MNIEFETDEEKRRWCAAFRKLLADAEDGKVLNATAEAKTPWQSFWEAWPRRDAKKPAQVKFEKLKEAEQEACIAGAKIYAKECFHQSKEKAHIMLPTTFINQQRWADEGAKVRNPVYDSTPKRSNIPLQKRKPNIEESYSPMPQEFKDLLKVKDMD